MEYRVFTTLLFVLTFMRTVVSQGLVFPPTMITIDTALGKLRGFQHEKASTPINIFLGVPYAEPPKRFKKPEPSKPWSETVNAMIPGKICNQVIYPQMKDFLPSSDVSEDCLRCDIYAPVTSDNPSPKAVLVWLMDGRFITGQTGLVPMKELAMAADIVIVAVSYRLGVFGFLSTGDDIIPGNFGLWDQKMAIEWVKANINSFGGDPNRITVAGTEAGAVSASLQAITPLNIGNFQRLVIHSTFANSKGIIFHDALAFAQRLANNVCPDNSGTTVEFTSQQIYDCLTNKTDIELTAAAEFTYNSHFSKNAGYPFGPVIDNDFIPKNTDFESLMAVDVLTSLVQNEYFIRFYESVALIEFKYSFTSSEKVPKAAVCESFVPTLVDLFYKNVSDEAGFKKLLCDQYTSDDETEQSRNALRLLGDFFHYHPVIEQLNKHSAKHTSVNTYLSVFAETSPFNDIAKSIKWLNGSVDTDDIFFVIAMKFYQHLDPNLPSEYVLLAELMIQYWSNFIKTGNPNLSETQKWPKYEPSGQKYIKMDLKGETDSFLYKDRVEFWRNTVPNFLEPTTTTSTSTTTTPKTTTKATTTTTTTNAATTTTKKPLVVPKSTTSTTTFSPISSASSLRFCLYIFLVTCPLIAFF